MRIHGRLNKERRLVRARRHLAVRILSIALAVVPLTPSSVLGAQIVLENADFRLALSSSGYAESLMHKGTGQELLEKAVKTPFCQTHFLRRVRGMPFTEQKDDHRPRVEKNVATTLFSSSIRRQGDRLVIGFEGTTDKLVLKTKVTDHYIGFEVAELRFQDDPVERMTFFQLPIKKRTHFGDWLNVMWDESVAVNVLGTDVKTEIASSRHNGYRTVRATGHKRVALRNIGVALITSGTDGLLDRIARVERDYDLPRGVASRRREASGYSYYWAKNVTPSNVSEHIDYAKQGGFRAFMLSYPSFTRSAGHFRFNERYPNGLADLKQVADEIKSAGLRLGIRLHYNKAERDDPYVTGIPHPGLNMRRIFTLARPVSKEDTVIHVEQNPEGITRADERRILRIGNELIAYRDYTTDRPYKFLGCQRGHLETQPNSFPAGFIMGLLDVDSWTRFVRFDQRSSLPGEVAERIGEIYNGAGIEFAYYDGAEDVHPPDWYTTPKAMLEVYKRLDEDPLFGEAAVFSHFCWHLLGRGNPWDTQGYEPGKIKSAIREESLAEAPRMRENFTRFTFVRLGYPTPSKSSIGIQPDMIEYACSRGAAWGCPVSLWTGLPAFRDHPRTPDNLEVFRRWEEARAQGWIKDEHRTQLRHANPEHILLKDADGNYLLKPYRRIQGMRRETGKKVRAFSLMHEGTPFVVFWHNSGRGRLSLPKSTGSLRLWENFLTSEIPVTEKGGEAILPVAGRRYMEFEGWTRQEAIKCFQQAKVLPPEGE